MSAQPTRPWNETDVPVVQFHDLMAALSLWLARERQGLVMVGEQPVATIDMIEAAVIEQHNDDPSRGLNVLFRLRCMIAILPSRRFRHLLREPNNSELPALVAAAACLRLNADRGFSPVRMSWLVSRMMTTPAEAASLAA